MPTIVQRDRDSQKFKLERQLARTMNLNTDVTARHSVNVYVNN